MQRGLTAIKGRADMGSSSFRFRFGLQEYWGAGKNGPAMARWFDLILCLAGMRTGSIQH